MANLTTGQRLVQPAHDTNPIPGHDLVVFRKVGGGGHLFHSILRPGQKGPTLMERLALGSSFVAYAVTRDQNLRHKLTVKGLKSADHVGPFSLGLSLSLRVSDSRLLVEGLESDPLGRLEEEVREVLTRAASRMDWSDVQAPESDFEDELLAAPAMEASGRRIPSIDYLQEFAAQLGFHLRSIQISRSFSEEIGEETRVAMAEARRRKILEEQAETEARIRQRKIEQERLEAEERHALESMDRLGEIRQGITDNLNKILAQIADKVASVPELRRVVEELSAIRQEMVTLPFLGGGVAGNGAGREIKVVSGPAGGFLAAAAQEPLSNLLSRAFLLLGELPCEQRDRNRLFSSILHLVAEVALLDEANPTIVDDSLTALKERVRKLATAIQTREQREFLLQLQDPEWVRAELSRG